MTQQDDITQRLNEIHADAGYLFGRVAADGACAGAMAESVRARIDAIKALLSKLRAPAADQRGLLPCPFCGSEAFATFKTGDDDLRRHSVHCKSLDCGGQTRDRHFSEAEAIAAWNRRSALASAPVADERAQDVDLPWLRAYMHHQIASDRWVVTADQARDFARAAVLADRQARDALASAPVADERAALADLLDYVDSNTCIHESTHRGGAIWTICDGCGMKWADDEGGFVPHQDAPAVAAARAALSATQDAQPKTESRVGTNTGHGHVWARPDGLKVRCGGPGICIMCSKDHAHATQEPSK
jgi:Lar family restriction alleviation protein